MVDEHIGTLGSIAIAGNSGWDHSLIIELEPLILNAHFCIVMTPIESAMVVDDAHEAVLHCPA